MKQFFAKIALTFFLAVGMLMLSNQEAAAQEQWTYSMVQGGKTYKIHFQQERGTLTIQLYDSVSNKWTFATIEASNPEEGYYKIRAGNGNRYEIWTHDDGTLDCSSGNSAWTYYLN